MLTKFDIDFSFHQQLSLNVVKLWYITRGERKKKKKETLKNLCRYGKVKSKEEKGKHCHDSFKKNNNSR